MLKLLVAWIIVGTAPSLGAEGHPERDALLAEIAKERQAHLFGDPDLMVSIMSDSFTSIDAGSVRTPTRAESRGRFSQYFGAVAFRAWDDLAPPVLTFSKDGTMATALIQKVVRLVDKAQAGNSRAPVSETRFAWLEVWRKEGSVWRLTTVASTRSEPPKS